MIKALIERHIAVYVAAVLVIIVGIVAYITLPRESSPEIKQPWIFVTTIYAGVAAPEIESLVTKPIEEKIDGLEGITKITSNSAQSVSSIFVEFSSDVDVETALRRVKERVDAVKSDLPADAEDPSVKELNSADWPILIVTIAHPDGLEQIDHQARDLQARLKRVQGVLDVTIAGNLEREVAVELDPLRLQQYGLSINDVTRSIRGENSAIPGGTLRGSTKNYAIAVTGEIKDPELFKDIIVRSGPVQVKLRDLATVQFKPAAPNTISRLDGSPAITLEIKKRTGQNILQIVDKVKAEVEGMRSQFPAGSEITYTSDEAQYVRDMIADLENSMFSGVVLVLLVTVLFLGFRNSFFISLAIPFSMLMGFFILQQMGVTLNMVVLFSLIMALGMLVDDGIVVVENIFRHASMGKTRAQAALDGTREVAGAIISSTITNMLAFFPIIFMPGIMGDFMQYVPITIMIVLACSLAVAMTINPVFCAGFLSITEKNRKQMMEGNGAFAAFQHRYETLLRFFVGHPVSVTLGTFGVVMLGFVAFSLFGKEPVFFPKSDPASAIVKLEARQGTPLEETDSYVKKVEALVSTVPASLDHFQITTGSPGAEEYHKATIRVLYKPYLERKIPGAQSTEDLKTALNGLTGVDIKFEEPDSGPPSGHPVSYAITGDDYLVLGDVSRQVMDILNDYPELTLRNTDYEPAKPEISVEIDRRRAAFYGLSTAEIASTIRNSINGTTVGTYKQGTEEYDIVVRYADNYRNSMEELGELQVVTDKGERVPIKAVADIGFKSSVSVIKRKNLERSVEVWADFKDGVQNKAEVSAAIKTRVADLPLAAGYKVATGEGVVVQDQSTVFLVQAFFVAIFLITIVLIAQFNSVGDTAIIMSSVVLSLGGVFWGYALSGQVFVIIMSGMGCISLAGVVVKNCIVLIDYNNLLIKGGMPWQEAIVTSGKTRLRPVILTATTAVLGMVPIAAGVAFDIHKFVIQVGSEQSDFWKAFAWTMIYGLTFATIMTLVIVPTMLTLKYRLLDRFGKKGRGTKSSLTSSIDEVKVESVGATVLN